MLFKKIYKKLENIEDSINEKTLNEQQYVLLAELTKDKERLLNKIQEIYLLLGVNAKSTVKKAEIKKILKN